uniref:Uncharacterized protein n=1 Tax=Opuntia streptacantha TaxID=393608 RepID=A0A7C9DBE8_OPUST
MICTEALLPWKASLTWITVNLVLSSHGRAILGNHGIIDIERSCTAIDLSHGRKRPLLFFLYNQLVNLVYVWKRLHHQYTASNHFIVIIKTNQDRNYNEEW